MFVLRVDFFDLKHKHSQHGICLKNVANVFKLVKNFLFHCCLVLSYWSVSNLGEDKVCHKCVQIGENTSCRIMILARHNFVKVGEFSCCVPGSGCVCVTQLWNVKPHVLWTSNWATPSPLPSIHCGHTQGLNPFNVIIETRDLGCPPGPHIQLETLRAFWLRPSCHFGALRSCNPRWSPNVTKIQKFLDNLKISQKSKNSWNKTNRGAEERLAWSILPPNTKAKELEEDFFYQNPKENYHKRRKLFRSFCQRGVRWGVSEFGWKKTLCWLSSYCPLSCDVLAQEILKQTKH